MHVSRWGKAGPRVVLVHGSAQGSKVGGAEHFSAQRWLTERDWQLVVPDRPGHGQTPNPGRPDDAELDGALIADLLDDGAHLVGHSFGGAVALAAAAKRPEAVRSLTLIEPAMQKLATHDPNVRRFGLKLLATMLFSVTPERRAAKFSELVGIPPEIRGGKDRAELRRMGEGIKRLKVPSAKTLRGELGIVRQAGIPLLVVTGGWSPAFDATGRIVAETGSGSHVVVPSPHHFPNMVSNQFNEILFAFMTESDRVRAR